MKNIILKIFGFSREEIHLFNSIISARKIQDFLWGEFHEKGVNLEEWKRMFKKRMVKIDEIDINKPHAKIELKKRVIQNAALSIKMLNQIDTDRIDEESDFVSSLPEYSTKKNPYACFGRRPHVMDFEMHEISNGTCSIRKSNYDTWEKINN